MKYIIIENQKFPFDEGCRLLKLKHTECPYKELEGIWDEIKPFTFVDISQMSNMEHRRVGINCLGLERLVKEVKPKLIDRQTIKKNTTWINENGEVETINFDDTYELFKVDGKVLSNGGDSWRRFSDTHFVKFKDTSTSREYMIWVDVRSVKFTNQKEGEIRWFTNGDYEGIDAIKSIAWTIQTNVPIGNIKKIVRQGDCVLIQPKDSKEKLLETPRHLTEKEYRKYLLLES